VFAEQTATFVLYNINSLVFITEVEGVYSAVRTGSLNKAVCASSVKPCFVFTSEQTATYATYRIKILVFITEMKSVYSAVRTGSLNKTDRFLSLKGESFNVYCTQPSEM